MAKNEVFADQEFVEYLVKSIVDNPEDVKVSRQVDEMGVLLTLKVNTKDMGQVIGREGSTRGEGKPSKSKGVDDVVNDLKL